MLTTPWALLALVSVPIVLGIYFFRTRSRRREVSSLFLWVDRSQARQGGRRLQRLQLPLLVLLELLVLILLAVAAARPMFRIEFLGRPTTIILDASYSMTAGFEEDSAQKRAVADLHRMLDGQIGFPVQFILAESKPRLLAGRAKSSVEAREMLDDWICNAPTADIDAAVSLASNISTPGTKILVVTDHAPKSEIAEGKVLWKAYGKPLDNLAIIHASRVVQEDKDRLLLEIANFSMTTQPLKMTIVEPKKNRIIYRDEKLLEPGRNHLVRFGIPADVETIEVRLADDALAIDNRLILLPPSRRPVRVRIDGLPTELAMKVRKAVESTGSASIVTERPELLFGNSGETVMNAPNSGTGVPWTVQIVAPAESNKLKSFIGPFIVDHQHPLLTGLSLDGVVWSADENFEMDGFPIISAGDVPLLTEFILRNGTRHLTLQLNDRLSTLTSHPAWPILIWNILKYRSSRMLGVAANNLKLGAEAEFIAGEDDKTIEIQSPSNETKSYSINSGSLRIPADQVGLYRIKAASGVFEFAVGALSTEESNLLKAETRSLGNWFDEETLRSDFKSIVWILLLASLGLLTTHLWFVSAEQRS